HAAADHGVRGLHAPDHLAPVVHLDAAAADLAAHPARDDDRPGRRLAVRPAHTAVHASAGHHLELCGADVAGDVPLDHESPRHLALTLDAKSSSNDGDIRAGGRGGAGHVAQNPGHHELRPPATVVIRDGSSLTWRSGARKGQGGRRRRPLAPRRRASHLRSVPQAFGARHAETGNPLAAPGDVSMPDRREFLRRLGAALALGTLPRCADVSNSEPSPPPPPRPGEEGQGPGLGIQLYTLRGILPHDFDGTLARLAEIGYREVEFAGYHGREPAAVRSALARAGLAAPSAHVPIEALEDDWPRTLEAAQAIGHEWLVVAWV